MGHLDNVKNDEAMYYGNRRNKIFTLFQVQEHNQAVQPIQ